MVTKDQRNSGYRGTVGTEGAEEQWLQKTRGTVGTEEQWEQREQRNGGYKRPEEQWVQKTREKVSTEDQRKFGCRGMGEQWGTWEKRIGKKPRLLSCGG